MTYALQFPGQGAQYVGMGKDFYDTFPEAREVFQEVDDALQMSLSSIIFQDQDNRLSMTAYTQPALMTVSVAILRVLLKQLKLSIADACSGVAGHSLGEYTAYCAAGAFSLAEAARLLQARGTAMQAAVPAGAGAMVAILGGTEADIKNLLGAAVEYGTLEIANYNAPGQTVLSGTSDAVEFAVKNARNYACKRAVKLDVSAPFHSSLMAPAAKVMREKLENISGLTGPEVPLYANVTGRKIAGVDEIRQTLVDQVCGSVRWIDVVKALIEDGADYFIEIGAGKTLTGLLKRINPEITADSIETVADLDRVARNF